MILTAHLWCLFFFFFQAEDGRRDAQESRGLGDVYKRQIFAGGVEGIQYLLSYRAFNINDMIGNIIGVVLGFIAFGLFHFYLPQNNDK